MDITIGSMIERVKTPYNKGVESVNSRLSDRYIYSVLMDIKNKLVTQQIKKKQVISDWNYSVLSCVELIKVANHECPCLPDLGCKVYRTKYTLPKPLTDLNVHLFKYVMNITTSKLISSTTREAYINNEGNKYTSKGLKYIIEKGYLYVYGKDIPQLIKIKYLAEDAIEAANYPSICGNDCVDCNDCESMLDKTFPVDSDMIDDVIQMANIEIAKFFKPSNEDINNDNIDNITEEGK